MSLRWYATHGAVSPKTGRMKPFLSARRGPKGEEHRRVQSCTWYRTPLYKDSHLAVDSRWAGCRTPLALCGRGLEMGLWWIDLGYEEVLGTYYLIVDERKVGKCSECRSRLKELERFEKEFGLGPAALPLSPFAPGEETERAMALSTVDRIRHLSLVAIVQRAFPGSTVEKAV